MSDIEVRLIPVERAHLEVLFEHEQERAGHDMAAFTRTRDPRDRVSFFRHWDDILGNPDVTARAVCAGDDVVGYLVRFVRMGDPELAYRLGRAHWGRGFATAAVAAFLGEWTERPLFARVAADNPASRRVLEKNGFVVFAHERTYAEARADEIDELLLRLDPA